MKISFMSYTNSETANVGCGSSAFQKPINSSNITKGLSNKINENAKGKTNNNTAIAKVSIIKNIFFKHCFRKF